MEYVFLYDARYNFIGPMKCKQEAGEEVASRLAVTNPHIIYFVVTLQEI